MVTSRSSNAMKMKREKNAAAIIEPKDEPVPCDEAHVLAVDDCLIDRKVIEKLLTSHSFKVTTVESAARALEFLGLNEEQSACPCSNSLKVNMIITDYCMPEMTGYDLLKKVKETKGLKEIPVVIMSSENVPQRVTSCLAEGAEDFIIKPVKLSDIMKLKGHINRAKSAESGSSSGAVSTKRKVWPGRVRSKLSERRPRVNALLFP